VKRSHLSSGLLGSVIAPPVILISGSLAHAAPLIIDDFEAGEGHFNSANPLTASGTNRNMTAVTADQTTSTPAQQGAGAQIIAISPQNPGLATDFPSDQFRLRHLSGGGTVANNVNIGPDGYVGYFLKTTVANLRTAVALDDGAALELGVLQDVNPDGQWHLYQWNLDTPTVGAPGGFTAFAGTGPNGLIEGPNVSIDSIFIQGLTNTTPTPLNVYLDTVAYNTSGDLSSLVPEPASIGIFGIAALGLLARRRSIA